MKVIDVLAMCDIAEEKVLLWNVNRGTLDTLDWMRCEATIGEFVSVMNAEALGFALNNGSLQIAIRI